MKNASRRGFIRTVSFILAAFFTLGASAALNAARANTYRIQVQAVSERALNELGEYVANIETSLEKGLYANTATMINKLSMSLRQEAAGAKSSLSQLSLAELELENMYRFLSQIGEFALSISRKIESGAQITQEERQKLTQLANYARELSKQIDSLRSALGNGSLQFEKISNTLPGNDSGTALAAAMEDVEQSMADLPTLIYDGPFSDHIMQRTPKMTTGKEEITLANAKSIAAKFSGIPEDKLENKEDEGGVMPSYGFSGNSTTLSITKNGGYLSYMLSSRFADEVSIDTKTAIAKAQAFLNRAGYKNMKESYYTISDGICTINFAYTVDNVTCYPDLIKVSVAMDNGDVTGLDARGFLMNHQARNITKPALSQEQAAKSVSQSLQIKSARLAVIPTDSMGEKYCYEFHCTGQNSQEVLIYIDTTTGMEDNILLLTYSDDGVFAK